MPVDIKDCYDPSKDQVERNKRIDAEIDKALAREAVTT